MFFYRVQSSTKHSNRFEHNDQWKRLINFSATSSSEWNRIFQNFQKEDNLARNTKVFSRNFFFVIQLFLEFVGWFREISSPCAAVSKFSKVLVEWKAPTNYLGKFLSFGPSFSLWRTTLQTETTVEIRAQDNYRLQTSFCNIKVHPKNSNHAQVFEVTGAPLTRARSPDKLSCKSENGVGDRGDTFKAHRIRARIPYTLRFRDLQPSIFWQGIKKLDSEPSTFYISLLSPLSFHVCGVCPSFYCCDL